MISHVHGMIQAHYFKAIISACIRYMLSVLAHSEKKVSSLPIWESSYPIYHVNQDVGQHFAVQVGNPRMSANSFDICKDRVSLALSETRALSKQLRPQGCDVRMATLKCLSLKKYELI